MINCVFVYSTVSVKHKIMPYGHKKAILYMWSWCIDAEKYTPTAEMQTPRLIQLVTKQSVEVCINYMNK